MSAKVHVAGWEAWCVECGDGNHFSTRDEARSWANRHNQRFHSRVRILKGA